MKTACQKFWGFSNSLDSNDYGRFNPYMVLMEILMSMTLKIS